MPVTAFTAVNKCKAKYGGVEGQGTFSRFSTHHNVYEIIKA